MSFKLKKANFQGHVQADRDPNMRVIWNEAIMRAGVGGQKVFFQIKFTFICSQKWLVDENAWLDNCAA